MKGINQGLTGQAETQDSGALVAAELESGVSFESLGDKYIHNPYAEGFDITQVYPELADASEAVRESKTRHYVFKYDLYHQLGQGLAQEEAQRKQTAALMILERYKTPNGGYDIAGFMDSNFLSPGQRRQYLLDAGFTNEDIIAATQQNVELRKQEFEAREEYERRRPKGLVSTVWQGVTPWDEMAGESASLKGVGIMAAEVVVPGVYTARHWDEMSGAERAFGIGIDALSIIPFVSAAAKGAKGVGIAGRGLRLTSAAKAVGREALMQARAPVDMIFHPIETAKGGVRSITDLVENIADPRKIPEAVLTTSEGTVRLRVSEATTPDEAMRIRDTLMELAAQGERPIVEVNGQVIELSRSPFMQETGGGLVHGTSNLGAFEGGTQVKWKPGMPLEEQGLFLSHEPLPRFISSPAFASQATEGGVSGILVISPESATKTISSNKIYKSPGLGAVAEMERKIPVFEYTPDIKQRLFTRVGPNKQRVEIWLEEPLSAQSILKLKGKALVEDLKAPFNPAISIKGTGAFDTISEQDAAELIEALARSGNTEQARALANTISTQRVAPRALDDIITGTPARTEPPVSGEIRKPPDSQRTVDPDEQEWDEIFGSEDDNEDVFGDADDDDVFGDTDDDILGERVNEDISDEGGRIQDYTNAGEGSPVAVGETLGQSRQDETQDEPRSWVEEDEIEALSRTEDQEDRRAMPREETVPRSPSRVIEETRRPPARDDNEPRRSPPRDDEPRRDEPRRPPPRDDEPRRDETPDQPRRDSPRTDTREPRRVIPEEDGTRAKAFLPSMGDDETLKRPVMPKGTVAWKQGFGYWSMKPPYNTPESREFTREEPEGAIIVRDAKTAAETIQSIGGPTTVDLKMDLGIMDVEIDSPPQTPGKDKGGKAITFKRDRTGTHNVNVKKAQKPKSNSKRKGVYYYGKGGGVSRKKF